MSKKMEAGNTYPAEFIEGVKGLYPARGLNDCLDAGTRPELVRQFLLNMAAAQQRLPSGLMAPTASAQRALALLEKFDGVFRETAA